MDILMSDKESRCLMCGEVFSSGRVDRLFCSTRCKNMWHNRLRMPDKNRAMVRVLRMLYKNRNVLEKLIKLGVYSVDRLTLIHLGFNMSYFTSMEKIRHRWVYSCLDIQYELTPTRIKHMKYLWEGVDDVK